MLQQEPETWELYAGNPWDVDEQNSGWYYLDVLVNKQIWLIKAGRPQRFLPPSGRLHPLPGSYGDIRFHKRPGWKWVSQELLHMWFSSWWQGHSKSGGRLPHHGVIFMSFGEMLKSSCQQMPILQLCLPAQRTGLLTNTEGLAHKHTPPISTSHCEYFRCTSCKIKLAGSSSFLETVQPSSVIAYTAGWLPTDAPDTSLLFSYTSPSLRHNF